MNVTEIRAIAQKQGIKAGKLSKIALVRSIQTNEGNNACYGTVPDQNCDQTGCLWRVDCFKDSRRGS